MLTTASELTVDLSHAPVALFTLARPQAANALNASLATQIREAFSQLPGSIRAVVLTGEGSRAFCAGADLKERKGMDEAAWHAQHHAFEEAMAAVAACPVPVIAAVNGAAFGGGLELALACDFIYASDNARFALTETSLGIIPGMAGTQRLPRTLGMARAKELIYMAKTFTATEAFAWGMVNSVYPPDTLLTEALAAAGRIAANAPLAVKAAKRAIEDGAHLPIAEAHACELLHYNGLLKSRDRHEGINAFNDKRKPVFTGQ